jgi:hypothetical protein
VRLQAPASAVFTDSVLGLAVEEEGFDSLEVGFGVYADGVEVGGGDVDGDAVFEEAELFEALGVFEGAVGEGGEDLKGGFAVGIEADVLPIRRFDTVAVIGDGGAGEVEGAAVGGGDDFDGVGVGDVFGGTEDFERSDIDGRVAEGREEGGEVLGLEEGLVALDVDVDGGIAELSDGVEAVGAGGEVGGGHLAGPGLAVAEIGDLVGVGGDEDFVELGAGAGGLIDPGEHGASGDGAKHFAGEARRGEAGGDDSEDGLLFWLLGIKYDWTCWCRGEFLLSFWAFLVVLSCSKSLT